MTQQVYFDDEYTGPRWTYGLVYRPIGIGTIPDGWVIGSDSSHPDYKRFGTIDYPRELTEKETRSFELQFIGFEDDFPPEEEEPAPGYYEQIEEAGAFFEVKALEGQRARLINRESDEIFFGTVQQDGPWASEGRPDLFHLLSDAGNVIALFQLSDVVKVKDCDTNDIIVNGVWS